MSTPEEASMKDKRRDRKEGEEREYGDVVVEVGKEVRYEKWERK